MAHVISNMFIRAFDANGDIAPFARMYWFAAGTETPATVYSDENLTVPHAHPIDADLSGVFPTIYAADGDYKIRLVKSLAAGGTSLHPDIDFYTVATGGGGSTSLLVPTSTKTSNYTVIAGDQNHNILVDASGAPGQNVVISVNSATLGNGFPVWITNTGAAGTVTIQGSGAQTIDGAASFTLPGQNSGVGITSLGAGGWRIFTTTGGIFIGPVTFSGPVTLSRITGGSFCMPSGRATLVTATPVLITDQTAKSTVFFTPYNGNRISLYNGTDFSVDTFTEVSQALSDATKSPAVSVANSVYYLMAWSDAGTFRVTRGPAWTSSSNPGTGAGTAELEMFNGVRVNKFDITNGPLARRGVMVGCIETDAANQMNMMFAPAAAAGGSNNRLDVWNMFNRVAIASNCRDSTDTWAYSTKTWRSANNSTSNRITLVCGLIEDSILARYTVPVTSTGSVQILAHAGIGLNVTNAFSGTVTPTVTANTAANNLGGNAHGSYSGLVSLGSSFIQAIEAATTAGTTTWQGDNGEPTFVQGGLTVNWLM
jgi:hypothetical protein